MKHIALTFLGFEVSLPLQLESGRGKGVADILSREWKARMWTLQETVLASNPILCCGDKSLPWRNFAHSMTFIERSSIWTSSFSKLQGGALILAWSKLIDLGRDAHYGRGAAHVINSMLQAQNQQSKPQRLPDISPHIQVYVSSYFHLPATYLPFCCHCWINLRREHECR